MEHNKLNNTEEEYYITIPVYSEERNEDGTYDVIGTCKEYV